MAAQTSTLLSVKRSPAFLTVLLVTQMADLHRAVEFRLHPILDLRQCFQRGLLADEDAIKRGIQFESVFIPAGEFRRCYRILAARQVNEHAQLRMRVFLD